MRTEKPIVATLLVLFAVSRAGAQTSTPSLQDAERAFADALLNHDRAAFTAAFTPDAECTLPSKKRGPEEIAAAWLPFFVDPDTTMVLTSTGAIVAESRDIGNTTGTFAIKGRTSSGIRTIPVGIYSIVWRLVDGRWKIGMLNASPSTKTERGGVGPYRFGMTPSEVTRVPDCQPYTNVSQTGGLECDHYRFEGREMTISFLFGSDRLRRIQLWFYQGESEQEAQDAVGRAVEFLQRTAGSVIVAGLPQMKVNPEAVIDFLKREPLKPGQVTHLEITTPSRGEPEAWFSRVGRHQYGYLVMIFADPR